MSEKQGLTLAFAISLVGGLIVLIFSLVNLVWFGSGAPSFGGFGDYMRSIMGGYHNFMGTYASSTGFFTAVSVVSFVCGVIILMSALVLRIHPQEHVLWGVVIVVFSAVSFVGMGGYFVGAVFGIIGGALALTYKPLT
ncbi:MAG: DUF6114 domain-containing protein [Chloroflexi bacterium]|nr:DUF6114 domain-containing protein [Chloroflexota bacterium]